MTFRTGTLTRRIAAATLLATIAVAHPGFAANDNAKPAAPATAPDAEKTDGYKPLFNGKTTEGWRNYKKQDVSEGWTIEDGALVCKHGGDLITKENYGSFDLILEYKISKGGNSGVMFHVTEEGGAPYETGPEVQVQDNQQAHDPQLAGWLYQLEKPPIDPKTGKPIDATKPQGEWNTLRIRLDGPHGTVWMNGVKYEDFEMWTKAWDEKVAKTKFGKMPHFAKARTGHIDLQDHGNEVAFRNIRIKVLDGK